MQFLNPIVGGIQLIRQAIRSSNYVPNAQGWTINQDGSAQFNNLSLQGSFNGVNYIINSNGAFFYSGAPALGNLGASIANNNGVDAYGNNYIPGVTTYDDVSLLYANMIAGQVTFGTLPSAGGVPNTGQQAAMNANTIGVLNLASNVTNTAPDALWMTAFSGVANAISGAGNNPKLLVQDLLGNSQVDIGVTGSLVKMTMGIPSSVPYTWQSPALGSGWASGPASGTYQGLQFRLDAEDNLFLNGTVHTTSASPSSTVFTLPAGYIPKKAQRPPCTANSGGTYSAHSLELINGSGSIIVDPTFTISGADLYINAKVPMGNIP